MLMSMVDVMKLDVIRPLEAIQQLLIRFVVDSTIIIHFWVDITSVEQERRLYGINLTQHERGSYDIIFLPKIIMNTC
ncbi:MAG: hypothetical protein M3Y53_12865 [Thermoproteota archaeon]|nr:hypothetical protein [Thermoproteota archaeon]